MATLKRNRAKKRLVLDVGASAVRLCELSQTKTGFQLTRYIQRDFPITPDMPEEEQFAAKVEVVKTLLKDSKVRHKKTVFGVPGQSVFTRTRMLPPVPEYKLAQIVRYEIQQQIPFSLDQIAHDFQVLERTEAGGYDVLMAAIKVDVVDKRLNLIKQVKRQIDVVDVNPLAAYNWLKFTGEFGEQGECVALVDIGAATTDIVIEREGKFRFTRSLNIAGNDITSALAREFNMEWPKAEQLKRERGFAPSGDPQKDGKGGEVIGGVLTRLVSEVSKSFAYFRSQPGGGPVARVILTGGGACLRNIVPFLQRQLGVEVRIAQPLAGLAIAPGAQEANDHPEQAAVALGLALRCRQPVTLELNLIPPRILEAARTREQVFYWALSVVALLFIMVSVIPVEAQKNQQVLQQIDMFQRALFQYDPAFEAAKDTPPAQWSSKYEAQLTQAKTEVDAFRNQVVALDSWYATRISWLKYINVINDARPRGKLVVFDTIESCKMQPRTELVRTVARGRVNSGGLGLSRFANINPTLSGPQPSELDKVETYWEAKSFVTIDPMADMQSAADDDDRRGRRSRSSTATEAPKEYTPPETNGISVFGYAQNNEVVLEFVENLRKSGEFLEGAGVYFDPATVNPVPPANLNDAGSERGASQTVMTPGMSADEDLDDRGRRSSGGGGFGSFNRGGSREASDWTFYNLDQSIVTFQVHLQFIGDPVTKEAVESKADEAIASGEATADAAFEDDDLDDRGRRRR